MPSTRPALPVRTAEGDPADPGVGGVRWLSWRSAGPHVLCALQSRIPGRDDPAAFCEATGADVREVAKAIGADSRIGKGAFINPSGFWLSMAIVALLAVTGVRQFRRMEKRFADVI